MKNIVITISNSHLNRLKSVADLLCKEGLVITTLYEFGVIIGTADEKIIHTLRQHEEVISLTEEKQANISPPDAEVQ
jgi:hypothetical protein